MLTYRRILFFVGALPFSILLFGVAWTFIAPEHLYHCWDDAPPFMVSWLPPFIHSWANSTDGKLSDFFIWPAWSVYLVWIGFVAGTLLIPAYAARVFVKRENFFLG